jgi:ankyrin repeat/BTB/POZ domain-containing protein 1
VGRPVYVVTTRCANTFSSPEPCLYNALNDRIRNLLLQYDFSKSTDPLQPLAAHTTSLLSRPEPKTTDILVTTYDRDFALHKFILAARSPYFAEKLAQQPDTTSWKLPPKIPSQSFNSVVRYLYLGEASAELSEDAEEQKAILAGIDKLGKQLEVPKLFESIIDAGDRRTARQRRTEELARGRDQFATWFRANVLRHKVHTDTGKADQVKWDRDNAIFADVLLRADEPEEDAADETQSTQKDVRNTEGPLNGIPIGNFSSDQASTEAPSRKRKSVLFPVHRAMLLRSEFFSAMFSSSFREAQDSPHLHIIPIDCSPQVLEIVLTYLYTEKADFSLEVAVDVLFAADLLFIEKLKQRAAVIISTLGNGGASIVESENPRGETAAEDVIDVYDIIRAGWDTRVHRLEEFGARFIAYRLERFIDDPDFEELVKESASRIQGRQETDTVELIDE